MKVITPISHLFNNPENAAKIAKLSDGLEARERTCNLRFKNTSHYHIDFDLNLGLTEKQIEFLKCNVKKRDDIEVLTFQATKDFEKTTIKNGIYQPIGTRLTINEQLERTKKSIKEIKNIVGSHKKIGLENNNYYPSSAYDIATSKEYIVEAANQNDINLLFDYAHAKVSCINRKDDFEDYSNFLLDNTNCIQLHLCKHRVDISEDKCLAIDAHDIPSDEITEDALKLCKKYSSISALTIEFYQDSNILVNYLKILNNKIKNNFK